MEAALRFDDLHRRLKLLDGLKNRAPILHLLHALSDTGTPEAAARRHAGAAGIPQLPPRMFSEPAAGLSGVEHVAGQGLGAATAGYGRGLSNGRALAEEGRHGDGMEIAGERADRHRPGRDIGRATAVALRTAEVTERTVLKAILYAFQVRRVVGGCGGSGSAVRTILAIFKGAWWWVKRPFLPTGWAYGLLEVHSSCTAVYVCVQTACLFSVGVVVWMNVAHSSNLCPSFSVRCCRL